MQEVGIDSINEHNTNYEINYIGRRHLISLRQEDRDACSSQSLHYPKEGHASLGIY